MLFELDPSLITAISSAQKASDPIYTALELIALSRREGNHIVFSEIETAEKILEAGKYLSESTRSLLRRLVNQYPIKAGLEAELNAKVLIGDFSGPPTASQKENKAVISIPFRMVNTSLVQKTSLLVENLQDAVFYKILATIEKSRGSVPVDFEAHMGGGNTTAEVFAHISAQNRLCLCVVDSDVRYPGGPAGETAEKVKKIKKDSSPVLSDLYVLPVSSIENLIPLDAIRYAFKDDAGRIVRVNQVATIYSEQVWPYFPLKKGIKCVDVVDKRTAAEMFWAGVVGISPVVEACREKNKAERCPKREDCSHFIFPSLGSKTLESVLKSLEEKGGDLSTAPTLSPVKQGWQELTALIRAWCCVGAPLLT